MNNILRSRRGFLGALGYGAAALSVERLFDRGVFAEQLELTRTAAVEEGPFYPTKLPLDTDNDLIIVNDAITPAVGDVAHVSGRLLDAKGNPMKNALIEIWQCDATATYLRERPRKPKFDANFQGFGRFLTGSTGEYYFRTIKPVPYSGRPAPHIHFKIKSKGREAWNTQLFIKGFAGNERDGIYRRLGASSSTVSMDFVPIAQSNVGEVAAKFDIVLGFTAEG
jgi:protocatechuate 3,4-dioxygenase beta subunit